MSEHDEAVIEQVERELVLPAPPEELWKIVTGDGWLADEVRLDLVPGGEAAFGCERWTKEGWVEEASAPAAGGEDWGRLVFWWSPDPSEAATRVELTLEPAGDGLTRLRVVEARPLELLDVVGIPLRGSGEASRGPAMLLAA